MIKPITRRRFLVGALGLPVALTGGADRLFAGSGIVHEIEIKSFEFNPSILEVRPGDQIRWVNRDISPHTATAEDGRWDTGELQRGQSAKLEVTRNMSTAYFCAFHPNMRADFIIL